MFPGRDNNYAELTDATERIARAAALYCTASVLVIVWLVAQSTELHPVVLAAWMTAALVVSAYLGLCDRTVEGLLRRAFRRRAGEAAAAGAVWGAASILFMPDFSVPQIQAFSTLLGGVTLAALLTLMPSAWMSAIFLCEMWIPYGVSAPHGISWTAIVPLLSYGCVIGGAATLLSAQVVTAARLRKQLVGADQCCEQARESIRSEHMRETMFFVSAADDLRQPLQVMALLVHGLRQTLSGEGPRIHEMLGRLRQAYETLASLIGETIQFGRVAALIDAPHPRSVLVGPLLRKLGDEFKPAACAKDVELRVRHKDFVVHTDPEILERILFNLLSNAIRYTTTGGVLIVARGRPGCCRFEVVDTGAGIASHEREFIFKGIYQGSSRPPQALGEKQGVGLGLLIAQGLCHALDTRLELTSEVGKGSRFWFDVPFAPQAAMGMASGESVSSSA